MNTSESMQALRRANPRATPDFPQSAQFVTDLVRAQISLDSGAAAPRVRSRRRRLLGLSAAGASVAGVVLFVTAGLLGSGTSVEGATAAVRKAATVTAASAERSGTAVVRITHNGETWAGSTIRWHAEDVAVSSDISHRSRKTGSELLVVDGTMYGLDPEGGWVLLGPPESIDPGSGTTPAEYLAAVRGDVGGATLRRIIGGLTGPITRRLRDGSLLYTGTVAAGLIATGSGHKEGRPIRVFPFGFVAHDEAADPASPLDTAVTVGAEGVIRKIVVTWPAWRYEVAYSDLGVTPALVAPANAKPLRRLRTG
jgi:hypothetical protein